jgi:UDP-N-acetylglucosamine--N-acetylmuramyl-(pentapeptide) pyrophosphoryl-undecaprenol N-acetylglucosamine transferase
MAGVFKGAMIESEVEDVCKSIDEAFENYDAMQKKALVYGQQCLDAADDLAEDILKKVNK